MNPVKQLANVLAKPAGTVAKAITNPTAVGRHRPMYGLNLLDALRSGNLTDTVSDRVVMVTGASSGIGAATARKIGAAGGEVVLVARRAEQLEETADAIRLAGGRAHVFPCDLADLDAISLMTQRVQEDCGGVDILLNNAARSIRRSLHLSYDRIHDYQRTMQVNYFGAVQLMLGVLPGMRERGSGHVVNISSAGVQTRIPRFGAYIASKAALDTLCDAWQAETLHDNVYFSTVHMVLVRTPMIEATTIYDRFPALTPDEAADVVCHAIVHRPRRSSPPFGNFAALADAISPQIMDRVRSRGFELFDDSAAAKGQPNEPDESITTKGKLFAEATGTYW